MVRQVRPLATRRLQATRMLSQQGRGGVSNGRSANGARRRSIRARVLATETDCALCGQPVDKTLKTPHPGSPEVDEIIPFSKGGSPYTRANTQLTHRRCNRLKSNRMPDEVTTTTGTRTWTTPREW